MNFNSESSIGADGNTVKKIISAEIIHFTQIKSNGSNQLHKKFSFKIKLHLYSYPVLQLASLVCDSSQGLSWFALQTSLCL